MAYRQDDARPLSEPMLSYCQGTCFNEILSEIQICSFKKMRLNMSSAKWRSFCPGWDQLMDGNPFIHPDEVAREWCKLSKDVYLVSAIGLFQYKQFEINVDAVDRWRDTIYTTVNTTTHRDIVVVLYQWTYIYMYKFTQISTEWNMNGEDPWHICLWWTCLKLDLSFQQILIGIDTQIIHSFTRRSGWCLFTYRYEQKRHWIMFLHRIMSCN